MMEWKEGFGMIQTVRKNFYNFNSKDIDKSKLSRKMQLMVVNPLDERSKEIVSGSSLNNCLSEG